MTETKANRNRCVIGRRPPAGPGVIQGSESSEAPWGGLRYGPCPSRRPPGSTISPTVGRGKSCGRAGGGRRPPEDRRWGSRQGGARACGPSILPTARARWGGPPPEWFRVQGTASGPPHRGRNHLSGGEAADPTRVAGARRVPPMRGRAMRAGDRYTPRTGNSRTRSSSGSLAPYSQTSKASAWRIRRPRSYPIDLDEPRAHGLRGLTEARPPPILGHPRLDSASSGTSMRDPRCRVPIRRTAKRERRGGATSRP